MSLQAKNYQAQTNLHQKFNLKNKLQKIQILMIFQTNLMKFIKICKIKVFPKKKTRYYKALNSKLKSKRIKRMMTNPYNIKPKCQP